MLNTIGIDKPILRDAPDLLRVDGSLRTNQGFQIAIPRGRYTMLADKVGVLEKGLCPHVGDNPRQSLLA